MLTPEQEEPKTHKIRDERRKVLKAKQKQKEKEDGRK
jgi:hypothetical protein